MATTQHYLWASGHFLLLLSALRYIIAAITFKTASIWWYKASYTGALVSYAIVCHKSLGTPQPSLAYVRSALLDENVLYFLLAFFWWSSKPITLTLIPYTIFSFFHALTFTRTTLMPQFLPPGPRPANGSSRANASGSPPPHPVAKKLQVWVQANYDRAMTIAAYSEILIFVRVALGALIFRNSFLSPIVYAHFLRQRYYQSAFTRHAFNVTADRINKQIQDAGNPPMVVSIWSKAQMLVTRWVGSSIAPNANEAPAGAARR